ncbi:hypothetical protein [Halorubrum persicum]|uniref:hypothetical protein n=1 Tax=Halorubrum persicum TaxID=1383844 RepID=UPI00118196F3|nr:hypothetical protein [Halorubrum persicum]
MSQLDSRGSVRNPAEIDRAVQSVNRHAYAVGGPRDPEPLSSPLPAALGGSLLVVSFVVSWLRNH